MPENSCSMSISGFTGFLSFGLILLKQANPYNDSFWLLISSEIFYWDHEGS